MNRDAEAEIRDLEAQGIHLDLDTRQAFREAVAAQDAQTASRRQPLPRRLKPDGPTHDPAAKPPSVPSKSTARRVATQKRPARKKAR